MENVLLRSFSLSFKVGGMTCDHNGNYVFTNSKKNKIEVFTPEGAFIRSFGKGLLNCPLGITCDHKGNYVICDTNHLKIQILSPEGEFVHSFDLVDNYRPKDILCDYDNNYVCIANSFFSPDVLPNSSICVYTSEGKFIKGFKISNFIALGISLDDDGNYIVSDHKNNRISIFTPEGKFIRRFGNFPRPTKIITDHDGNYIISCYDKIKILTKKGELISSSSENINYNTSILIMCDNQGDYVFYYRDYNILCTNKIRVFKGPTEIPSLFSLCQKQIEKNEKDEKEIEIEIKFYGFLLFLRFLISFL